MATHIVSWGYNDPVSSAVSSISSTSSIVSIDSESIIRHKHTATSAVQGTPASESSTKCVSGNETSTSASTYSKADPTDGSFIRHHKYFFKDGNVTFLVSGSPVTGAHTGFTGQIVCRLMEHSTVSIDISSLGTQCTFPLDSTSLAFVTTKLSLSPYH